MTALEEKKNPLGDFAKAPSPQEGDLLSRPAGLLRHRVPFVRAIKTDLPDQGASSTGSKTITASTPQL